jgi:hypothetical protein
VKTGGKYENFRCVVVAFITALIPAAASIAVVEIQNRALTNQLPGTLEDGQKLCTVLVPGSFSSTTIFPKTWPAAFCKSMLPQVADPTRGQVKLGCGFTEREGGINLGTPDGEPPRHNCGW